MSIGENPGTVEVERTVAPTPEVEQADPKQVLVETLAKSDNLDDYVRERRLQDGEQRGDVIPDEKKHDRADRAQRAREALLKEQQELREKNGVPEPEQREPDHDPAEQRAADERRLRAEGAFQARFKELAVAIPDFADSQITLKTFPPRDDIAEMIVKSDLGAEVAYVLGKSHEAIEELNSLPPVEAARWIGRLESFILNNKQQPKTEPARRNVTRASAPLSTLKGGAAPSQDVHSLAKSDDVSAYIAARNKQEAARGR
jgi:hypothetical protein